MTIKRLDYYKAAPASMKAMAGLEKVLSQSVLSASLKELVRIRASQLNGCAYCVDMHTKDAADNGETLRRISALTVWKETPFFNSKERAALLWTETLTLLSIAGASDDIYEEVAAEFNEQELAELTFLIAVINAWNRFGVGFAMQPE